VVSEREVVPQDERASESCLHCEINDLVQEHVEGQETVDMAEVAARMAESLVDFVLRAERLPARGARCNDGRARSLALPVADGDNGRSTFVRPQPETAASLACFLAVTATLCLFQKRNKFFPGHSRLLRKAPTYRGVLVLKVL
jgi:hypothetical protein